MSQPPPGQSKLHLFGSDNKPTPRLVTVGLSANTRTLVAAVSGLKALAFVPNLACP